VVGNELMDVNILFRRVEEFLDDAACEGRVSEGCELVLARVKTYASDGCVGCHCKSSFLGPRRAGKRWSGLIEEIVWWQ